MSAPRFVYFLRAVGLGLMKIGSSVRPESRLMNYAVWSPVTLELVATIRGDRWLEGRFHRLFMRDHSHGEWFRGSPRMDEVIRDIRAGTFDVDGLPPPMTQQPSQTILGRENRGLRVRLSHRFKDIDGRLPPHVKALYDALSLPSGPVRDEAIQTIRRLLAEAS